MSSRATKAQIKDELTVVASILDNAGAAVLVLDALGVITRVNEAAERVSGYSAEELCGQTLWDRLAPADEREAVRDVFLCSLSADAPTYYEHVWLTKGGKRRWLAWSNTVLQHDDHGPLAIVATGWDITDRVTLEEDLHRKIADLKATGDLLTQALDVVTISVDPNVPEVAHGIGSPNRKADTGHRAAQGG